MTGHNDISNPVLRAPRVSVVLPTHNRPGMLAEAVASVLGQTFSDWELIVVDDASDPPVLLQVSPELRGRLRCIRHSLSNGGAAGKNAGISDGGGEIFAFLDDDDLYDPRYLERAVAVLDQHSQIDVLFMGVGWFGRAAEWGERTHGESTARLLADAKPRQIGADIFLFGDEFLPALLRRVPMPFQRPVVRGSALARIGHYRSDCLLWDCEWALRASMAAHCAFLNEPLYPQRVDGQGYSSRADRELDHLKSGLDMTWQLYSQPPFPISRRAMSLLRRSASSAAISIARYYATRRQTFAALKAWAQSQSICPSVAGLRPLASIIRLLLRGAEKQG